MRNYIQLNEKDNVVVAISPLKKNDILKFGEKGIIILDDIPSGHKIAVRNISKKNPVIKYGLSIGLALVDITVGEHVHIHNITSK